MKRKSLLFLTIFIIGTLSLSVLGASVSQHLSSRLTVLSAKIYNEVNGLCPGEVYYQVAIVPVMDVNGEKPLLVRYLHKKMEDVVGMFPAIRVTPSAQVEQTWLALKAQGLSNQEIFREMGQRLGVSALLMTSMVTHPTHYTLNGVLVNTATFEQRQLETTVLDRTLLDTLTEEEILRVVTPATSLNTGESAIKTPETVTPVPAEEDTAQEETNAESEPVPADSDPSATTPVNPTPPEESGENTTLPVDIPPVTEEPGHSQPVEVVVTVPAESGESGDETPVVDNAEILDVLTEIIANAPKTPAEITPPVDHSDTATTPGKPVNTKPVEPKPPVQVTDPEPVKPAQLTNTGAFVLASESPLLDNLLLGFDLGDIDGDGTAELIYCGGMNIQVRSLSTYDKLWDFAPYRPASKDYTILAVDLDGDKADEIIYHGNLLKLVENELTSQQPRFLSRPVSLYNKTGVVLYNDNAAFIVNYQGLVKKEYPIGGTGKRFLFTDLEGDGTEELVVVYDGPDEESQVKVFKITGTGAVDPITLEGTFGYSLLTLDLNKNGRPEIYLRKNVFNGVTFLYSKIYAYESVNGKLQLIAESEKLNYFIVDFAQYPKAKPDRLVVGTMNLQSKQQSITEIQSKLFFYTLK